MNQTVVITGTTQGIGRVTAQALAAAGCHVIMLVRNRSAGGQVRAHLRAHYPNSAIEVIQCDLASLASVRAAAAQVRVGGAVIDCLINNAGMVSMRRELSADGFEKVFATNHLGPFLLTELVRPCMAPAGQIINVASRAHLKGTLDLGEVIAPLGSRFAARAIYAQSKLANVMHTFALARRLEGSGIRVNCLHPGVVKTRLLPAWLRVIKPLISPGMIDAEAGARSTLYLALSDQARTLNGVYLDEQQQVVAASALARSVALQEALWAASCAWAGLPQSETQ